MNWNLQYSHKLTEILITNSTYLHVSLKVLWTKNNLSNSKVLNANYKSSQKSQMISSGCALWKSFFLEEWGYNLYLKFDNCLGLCSTIALGSLSLVSNFFRTWAFTLQQLGYSNLINVWYSYLPHVNLRQHQGRLGGKPYKPLGLGQPLLRGNQWKKKLIAYIKKKL